jgi:hypothetical protein
MGDHNDYSYQQNEDEDFGVNMGSVNDSYEPIPEGVYPIQAVAQELKSTKDSMGQFISVTFQVTDGQYANRQIFENFNIRNQNQQTVDIALRAIKGWLKATGGTGDERLTMGLIRAMEGKEFLGQIYVEAARGQWDAKNRVRFSKCKPLDYQTAQPSNQTGQSQQQSDNQQPTTTQQATQTTQQKANPNLSNQPAKRPWER